MARLPRQFSSSGFYHVVFRGVNHCHLFEEDCDYEKMLGLLIKIKDELGIEVHAYCLMSNHVHLLLREKTPQDITTAMRRLLGPYAMWFNKKYQRSGALITNRYKSTCVETDAYLLDAARYIHQNPVSAGIVSNMEHYRWSSFNDYSKTQSPLTTTKMILSILSSTRETALEQFARFHMQAETQDFSQSDRQYRPQISQLWRGAWRPSRG